MGKSQETFQKREKEKKRLKAKQEKAEKMQERKANSKKGKSLEDMMAYIDENGNISDTPPDERKKKKVVLEDIQTGPPKGGNFSQGVVHNGTVSMFNADKGFGFINDHSPERRRIFFHVNDVNGHVVMNDKVQFEIQSGPKGLFAVNVSKT